MDAFLRCGENWDAWGEASLELECRYPPRGYVQQPQEQYVQQQQEEPEPEDEPEEQSAEQQQQSEEQVEEQQQQLIQFSMIRINLN